MRNIESASIRIWPILALGFSAMVLLVALSGWLALRRATGTYREITSLHDAEHETDQALEALRSDIAVSAIFIRDFLLDSDASVQTVQAEIERLESDAATELSRLNALVPKQQTQKLAGLNKATDGYWRSLAALFAATPRERAHMSFSVIQREIVPRRQAALKLVKEIEELNSEAFGQRRKDIDAENSGLASYVGRLTATTLIIALIVASLSIFRIYTLEQVSASQRAKVEATERELRSLSVQLVRGQEDERRALSRDLHDQVGQVLTALRISLGNLERAAEKTDGAAAGEWELAKRLLAQALRATRDLAMGLRPAMLDDLGLEAALEWHTRQHAKLYGVPVTLHIKGALQELSDAQKTCVYRIVQEALNNAGKYSRASSIDVKILYGDGTLSVDILDDGVGFNSADRMGTGLGLLGMRERIAQLGGNLSIDSGNGHGTAISAHFPMVEGAA